jgi:GT2 family glycosyltransferase
LKSAPPATTVIVVPRDSFSQIPRCLDTLLADTPAPRRLVYVDGGAPPEVAEHLRRNAEEHDFALIRSEYFLSPNQARNLALPYVDTEFVVFLDNNALVAPGWLPPLEECARETGAAIVGPFTCMGEPSRALAHAAGGVSHIAEEDGVRRFVEDHPGQGEPAGVILAAASRCPTELFEFHTVLVRASALAEVGPFDEGLWSLLEHTDLGLLVRERGGTVWIEPAVPVTYLPSRRGRGTERRFFLVRWSDDWNRRSRERFAEKWDLPADDRQINYTSEFGAWLRLHAYRPYRSPFTRMANRSERTPRPIIDRVSQRVVLRQYRKSVARSAAPILVHRPSWLQVGVDA